jgi:hypothetical protein
MQPEQTNVLKQVSQALTEQTNAFSIIVNLLQSLTVKSKTDRSLEAIVRRTDRSLCKMPEPQTEAFEKITVAQQTYVFDEMTSGQKKE